MSEDIKQKINRVDTYFRNFNIKSQDIKGEQRKMVPLPDKNFNSRGEEMLTPKQIKNNYQKAFYLFKWYQIPLCRKSIKRKLHFWAPASVALAWTYGEYVKKKDSNNIIKNLPFKFYMKSFGIFFMVTTIYCFGESIIFDEFCDIDSPFYQQSESRLSIARRIKGQMNKTSDETFLTSIFG